MRIIVCICITLLSTSTGLLQPCYKIHHHTYRHGRIPGRTLHAPSSSLRSVGVLQMNNNNPKTKSARTKSVLPTVPIPNPFQSLPWNVQKHQQRQARKLKMENSKLHRELGIAEDSSYEEITAVTQALIRQAEASGDIKKKIKVEVAKDRILQLRLNERLAGLATLTKEARAQSRVEEDEYVFIYVERGFVP